MISAVRHARRGASVAGVALLLPGIAAHVIAEGFPEAGLVLRNEVQSTHPLRAFPEVQVWDDEARWPSVSGRQRRVIELRRYQCGALQQICHRQVCRITAIAVGHYI